MTEIRLEGKLGASSTATMDSITDKVHQDCRQFFGTDQPYELWSIDITPIRGLGNVVLGYDVSYTATPIAKPKTKYNDGGVVVPTDARTVRMRTRAPKKVRR